MDTGADDSPSQVWKALKWTLAAAGAVLLVAVIGIAIRYESSRARLERLQSERTSEGVAKVWIGFDDVVPAPIRKVIGQKFSEPFDRMNSIDFTHVTDDDLTTWRGSYDADSIFIVSDARHGGITDRGLSSLAELQQLAKLEISGGCFTAQGIAALAKCPNLKSLHIDHAELSSDWYTAIGKLPHLIELEVGKEDEATAAEIEAIALVPGLVTVCLNGSSDQHTSPDQLFETSACANWCIGGEEITKELLAPLARSSKISSLSIQCDRLSSDALQSLAAVPSLRILQISGIGIESENLSALAGCMNLESLTIVNSAPDSKDLSAWDDKSPMDRGLGSLAEVRSLTQLALHYDKLSERDLASIAQLTQLKALRIVLEAEDLGLDLDCLKSLSKLNELDLRDIYAFDRHLDIIQFMPALRWLRFETAPKSPHALRNLLDNARMPAALVSDAKIALRVFALETEIGSDPDWTTVSIGQRTLLSKDPPPPVGIGF